MRRSQEEIVARIEAKAPQDWIGVISADLVHYLDFEQARPFLKDEVTPEQWSAREQLGPTVEAVNYMAFAWDKANNCRGISACRSVQHFESWLWLAGADGFDAVSESEYQFYGKPCLVIAASALGVDWRALDDGIWDNNEGGDRPRPGDQEIARLEAIGTAIREELQVPA